MSTHELGAITMPGQRLQLLQAQKKTHPVTMEIAHVKNGKKETAMVITEPD